MRVRLAAVALAGAFAGAATWYATSRRAETRDADLMVDARVRRSTAAGSVSTDAISPRPGALGTNDPRGSLAPRRALHGDSGLSRKIDWNESRDPVWAAPMERALGSLAEERLGHLLPEGRFRGVTCRMSSCSFEIACRADESDMCQQVASVLVLVDGMTLRIRQHATDSDGWVPMLVDVHLPPGDAEQLRAAISAELASHPEVTERLASYLEILRRERVEGPP